MSIWKYNGFGMLTVVKPLRILFFIIVWNLLCGLTILLNGSVPALGEPKTPGGYLGIALVGAFAAFSGFAPVASIRFRERWCRPDADFEKGRFGLVMLGLIGSAFVLVGLGSFVFRIAAFELPKVTSSILP